ncbi:Cullin [Protomyces lactucae-debilis]|uniref:Cullin n=1 Tax=Protomyces lactucae-debilis TaxID=2754530 RepID=A0A1Y2EVV7_PROLT|nr:Cullin [Protomyces lactucae-debilis]ORY75394.1 Cullin [Protomyces lactucae-debilis]
MTGRLKAKIRGPLKRQLGTATEDASEFDKSWSLLSDAFTEIHRRNAGNYSFEQLYRNAYQIVLKKQGERLYEGFSTIVEEHLSTINSTDLERAYVPLVAGKAQATTAVDALEIRAAFLSAILEAWSFHCLCMGMISDVLMYMDRVYSKNAHKPLAYDTGLIIFRDTLLHSRQTPTGERLVQAILDLIAAERAGALIDRPLIKASLEMLATLDVTNSDGVNTVYGSDFEVQFLNVSRAFYKQEAADYISSLSIGEYLLHVERRLTEEVDRALSYMQASTHQLIVSIVEQEMLAAHLVFIVEAESGLSAMLRLAKVEDLSRLHALLSRVDVDHLVHNDKMTKLIALSGERINASLLEEGSAVMNDKSGALQLALRWVQEVLDLRDKHTELLHTAYKSDQSVANAITLAFSIFINQNDRAAEFISLFIDDHLKKGLKGKSEEDVDMVLDKTVSLFRYLHDKDMFERYYKTHLGKRLLSGRSVSDDAERGMIARLKVEMGSNFTNKMEGMFKDIKLSNDNMKEFLSVQIRDGNVPLHATVLTSTFWPLTASEIAGRNDCCYPAEIDEHCRAFQEFYLKRFTGRQLTWIPSHGTADIKAKFGARSYELNVSTYAMVVLSQFNQLSNGASLSTAELQERTRINLADVTRTLQSLACAKYKILSKQPKSRDVLLTDRFLINEAFTNAQSRIKIATIANKAETNAEHKETMGRIEETRKHSIEACLVRIMKARKVADHNNLIAEATQQLSSKFAPDLTMIKGRIESLIERDYLERDEQNRKLYRYLA